MGLPSVLEWRRVRLLDPHTVNQIAAGEVVERPASALKELVENALDAGARRIEIELEASGRKRIVVRDDGVGMALEDALEALKRHATSKIRSAEDLHGVATLGFRGEALPSIASVSRLTLRTADTDGLRHVLRVEGGVMAEPAAEAGPRGTEIVVEDLFFNTPARLKFLKSDTTELGQCVDVVSRYAMAYPDVAFSLTHNGQSALRTAGDGDERQALADVWGRDLGRALAEVDIEACGLRIRGFVSPPHVSKPNRSMQFFFVNGRPVRTRSLTAALDQAYRDLTPDRRFPVVALRIEADPSTLDVNVSPTKSEVKFQSEGAAFEALRLAVRQSLLAHGMVPSGSDLAAANAALAEARHEEARRVWGDTLALGPAGLHGGMPAGGGSSRPECDWGALLAATLAAQAPLSPVLPSPEAGTSVAGLAFEDPAAMRVDAERYPFADLLDGLRVIGQAMNTFILAETSHGLAIIDQHVAHERILYEYLCGLKGSSEIERQPLLVPETLHLDRRSAILLREKLDELDRVGFALEPFGGESFVVRSAPAAVRGRSVLKLLRDLIDELVEVSVTRRLVPTREQIWITSACKMAVKAGDPLSQAEMEKLIVDLATTENPYLCPHGRPITLMLSKDDLYRKFKR